MIQQDAIKTVAEAWKGSTLQSFTDCSDALAASTHNGSTAILLILIAFLCILMFRRMAGAVGASFVAIFSPGRRDEIFHSLTFKPLALVATILLTPIFSFVIYKAGLSNAGFWWTLAVVAGVLCLRRFNFAMLKATVTGDCLKDVRKSSSCVIIIFMVLALPLYLFSLIWGDGGQTFYIVYLICAAAICAFPYVSIAMQKIISARFSLFFAILYLCAFEIMPLAVAIKVLID